MEPHARAISRMTAHVVSYEAPPPPSSAGTAAEKSLASRISESVADVHPMPGGGMAMRASVPIEPGTRSIEVEVHVTYALR